ncbi:MAG: NAD(P)/FAD-dependent oxidoreductase [Bacteroidales bacterium]|jgi:phytoene desaturase|nr:NAD(P)/FAD-dependent oxidoreductase [Bacteroidales bacterium]MDD3384791.1 phytoene desaturase family protein [Bacteroidales bacterium]MDD3870770.1 phytoene desaturase family protein [Bacteroidales bacterium]
MPKALIVGTGLGGLTTALRLASRGYDVEMVEMFRQAGGRLNQLKKDGFTWDMAPSFFSMSYEFKEFIDFCGIDMPFEFVELDPLYAVNFRGSNRNYQIYKDLRKLGQEFSELEPGFEEKARRFLKDTGRLFHDTENRVIRRNFDGLIDYLVSLAGVPWGHAPKMFRSVWSEMSRYFDSREVKEILSLVSFFLGATPFDTPAVYTLLSYTELVHDGYHNVRGGMYKIVEGLISELNKKGISIRYNTEIKGFEAQNGRLTGFTDAAGIVHNADVFVVNADAAVFRHQVFNRKKWSEERLDRFHWTMAPLTIYLGLDQQVDSLYHHHYFLGNNFKDYAAKIFKNRISLDQPYYYVNTLSRFNPESAPAGCETVFILCPVPHRLFKPDWSDRDQIVDNIIADLSARVGVDLKKRIISKTVMDPIDWEKSFHLHRGSGLGLAHDLNQIGHFRPKNVDEQFKNVFYVGSSTVPGTGLPMAVISSKLATERILQQYGPVH